MSPCGLCLSFDLQQPIQRTSTRAELRNKKEEGLVTMSRVSDSDAGQCSSGSSSVPPTPTPCASVARRRRAAALAQKANPTTPLLSRAFTSSPRSTSEPDLLVPDESPAIHSSSSSSSSQRLRSAVSSGIAYPSSDLPQTYTSSPAQPASSSSSSLSSRGAKRKVVIESPDSSRSLSASQVGAAFPAPVLVCRGSSLSLLLLDWQTSSEQLMSSSSSTSRIKRTSQGGQVCLSTDALQILSVMLIWAAPTEAASTRRLARCSS